jgi:hypothetical protein
VASAYLPAIASVKLRGSAAVGREAGGTTRFFGSLDLIF